MRASERGIIEFVGGNERQTIVCGVVKLGSEGPVLSSGGGRKLLSFIEAELV